MKKRLALLLAVAMLATLTLAGCGSKEEAGSAGTENAEDTFVVGFDAAFPPYGYKDDNGKWNLSGHKKRIIRYSDEYIKNLNNEISNLEDQINLYKNNN